MAVQLAEQLVVCLEGCSVLMKVVEMDSAKADGMVRSLCGQAVHCSVPAK